MVILILLMKYVIIVIIADKNFYDIKYNKMEYHKSVIRVIISIIASITIISILYFLQN